MGAILKFRVTSFWFLVFMTTFQSFEDIKAWQLSRVLLKDIRQICKRDLVKRDFSFIDQITRSTRSISANIAEGFESRTTTEFIAYLGIAKRSAGEVRSHLYDARDEQYITESEFFALSEQTKEIGRMLAGLTHYLQSTDKTKSRTLKNSELVTSN